MKFTAATIFTSALILGAQASVIPWVSEVVGNGLTYSAVSSPVVASPWAPWGHAVVDVPAVVHHANVYHSVVHHPAAPSVEVHAPVVVAAAEGSYVAQTRGAVHTAPLPGHTNSVANINLAPAPGTV
ncbi:adult cuticle protein 1-like [Haematobia irritans]|uniref:adult cuticle protein 1-like n=1 Tax=Haematobia irritans TaxID=7368 RepID=UPI003F50695A